MGHFSDLAIQEGEQALRLNVVGNKNVCANCFGDVHLVNFVKQSKIASKCDYCGEKGSDVSAAPLAKVLEFMLPQIELEFASADQSLPRDPETKRRMFPAEEFETREMLELYIDLQLPRDDCGVLMEEIVGALPEQDWCYINPLSVRDDEAISNSWEAFKRITKHQRRFFFLKHADEDLERDLNWGEAAYGVSALLERIARFVQTHGMLVELPADSTWIRVQHMDEEDASFGPRRMGPPPYEHANLPNRMSPAGIPMFYGAIDRETALAEVAEANARFACATFKTLKATLVVDVRNAPKTPSLFDPELAADRATAIFMQAFIEDFRAKIDRKKRPHVDYLPTQIVTEYFRTTIVGPDNSPAQGILYSSTKTSRDAIVLFAENEDVVEAAGDAAQVGREWLRMSAYEEFDFEISASDK